MNDRALIRTGAAGAIVAAICCATPILAMVLPVVGLGAWLAGADLIVFPLLFALLGVLALGVYRHRTTIRCETKPSRKA